MAELSRAKQVQVCTRAVAAAPVACKGASSGAGSAGSGSMRTKMCCSAPPSHPCHHLVSYPAAHHSPSSPSWRTTAVASSSGSPPLSSRSSSVASSSWLAGSRSVSSSISRFASAATL